ncbi:hypothetical protein LY78DRAFT_112976 [Colletotrichum sublineola]|nr:hypothetical protein LY78DRAFT_112976 [Colletotrichum sublineola]
MYPSRRWVHVRMQKMLDGDVGNETNHPRPDSNALLRGLPVLGREVEAEFVVQLQTPTGIFELQVPLKEYNDEQTRWRRRRGTRTGPAVYGRFRTGLVRNGRGAFPMVENGTEPGLFHLVHSQRVSEEMTHGGDEHKGGVRFVYSVPGPVPVLAFLSPSNRQEGGDNIPTQGLRGGDLLLSGRCGEED